MNSKSNAPFRFCSRMNISESTGLRAANIERLLELIKEVPGSSIYHHTHRYLQQHEFLSPEPPNDFAHWITDVLGESELGEKIASIDIIQFETIRNLREKLVATIDNYLQMNPQARFKSARPGKEFYFLKSVSFIVPGREAGSLEEFVAELKRIDISSIYFHIFEARLRLENKSNDFSKWIETAMGEKELADAIAKLDPYTYALEDLRKEVIALCEGRMRK